jgi:hypothetical protein
LRSLSSSLAYSLSLLKLWMHFPFKVAVAQIELNDF